MTETSISLLSILCGIIGVNLFGLIFKKYNLGITANSICGVFGSVFFIKSLGRLGFDPVSIMANGSINWALLSINLVVSVMGGLLGVYVYNRIKKKAYA